MHDFGNYVHVCARIIMKINELIYRYTDNLSLKFYEDQFIGCWQIAETKLYMSILPTGATRLDYGVLSYSLPLKSPL